jgi:hypothetical protein
MGQQFARGRRGWPPSSGSISSPAPYATLERKGSNQGLAGFRLWSRKKPRATTLRFGLPNQESLMVRSTQASATVMITCTPSWLSACLPN